MSRASEPARPDLPPTLPWEQRRGIQPMPGRRIGYMGSLRQIADHVELVGPGRNDLKDWLAQHFQPSPGKRLARNRISQLVPFLNTTRLIICDAPVCRVGDMTRAWLDHEDPSFVIAQLHRHVRYVGELLDDLKRQPMSRQELHHFANERGYVGARSTKPVSDQSPNPINYRYYWFVSATALTTGGDDKLRLTSLGEDLLDRLDLRWPVDLPSDAVRASGYRLAPLVRTSIKNPKGPPEVKSRGLRSGTEVCQS